MGDPDSFVRLEMWIAQRVHRPLSPLEREELASHVRWIVGDVFTVGLNLVGARRPHNGADTAVPEGGDLSPLPLSGPQHAEAVDR